MTIWLWEHSSRQTGAGAVAESLYLINKHKTQKERANWKWCGVLKSQSQILVTHLLQQGHTSSSFPNSSADWSPNLQTYESLVAVLI